jgi:hypothetical protein
MKNYKIIESRPELSLTQLEQGMDFTKIKSKAALASKTGAAVWSVKTIILNSVAGAVLIGGTVFGIKQFNNKPQKELIPIAQAEKKNKPEIKTDTVLKLKESTIETSIPTPTKSPLKPTEVKTVEANKPTQTVQAVTNSTRNVTNSGASLTPTVPLSGVVLAASSSNYTYASASNNTCLTTKETKFKQSENVTCTIIELITGDCLDLPKMNFPTGIECTTGCELYNISCDELSAVPYIKAVLLTITDPKTKLVLKTHFENIKLIRGKKIIHPIAIYTGDKYADTKKPKFLDKKFKSKGAMLSVGKKVDLIIIFEQPQIGDKLVFDGIEAIITEK